MEKAEVTKINSERTQIKQFLIKQIQFVVDIMKPIVCVCLPFCYESLFLSPSTSGPQVSCVELILCFTRAAAVIISQLIVAESEQYFGPQQQTVTDVL